MSCRILITEKHNNGARHFNRHSAESNIDYFPISKDCLTAGSPVTFSIYSSSDRSSNRVLSGSRTSPSIIDHKILTLDDSLYIDPSDIGEYAAYIFGISKKGNMASKLKLALMRERSNIVMKEIFEGPVERQTMQAVRELSDDMVKCILMGDGVLPELLTIKKLDQRVYVHSVNVAILSLALGRLLRLEKETLRYLGIGAFLHDIGKRTLPKEILTKQGRLTNREYHLYRRHVAEGIEFLESSWKVPAPAIAAVSQHHEVLSGKGYPHGLRGERVELFGRIVGIANSFDNLITPRPQKNALSPFDALRVLVGEKGNFDTRILSTFIAMLGNGPNQSSGTTSSLNSGTYPDMKGSAEDEATETCPS
jgi:putative nucleotidyltransferase with HDIG domain